MKRVSLFCTLALILCFFPVPSFAEEDPLEERIEHLEEHLFVVDAQLGKLELIRKSLEQMREDGGLAHLLEEVREGSEMRAGHHESIDTVRETHGRPRTPERVCA